MDVDVWLWRTLLESPQSHIMMSVTKVNEVPGTNICIAVGKEKMNSLSWLLGCDHNRESILVTLSPFFLFFLALFFASDILSSCE